MYIIGKRLVFRSLFSRHQLNGSLVEVMEICSDLDRLGNLILKIKFPNGSISIARSTELISCQDFEEEKKLGC